MVVRYMFVDIYRTQQFQLEWSCEWNCQLTREKVDFDDLKAMKLREVC